MARRGLSGKQVDRLGQRLRDSETPNEADLEMLGELLREHDAPMRQVADALQGVGLKPTVRLKTWGTLVEKLKRERLHLSLVRDIAGARIVQRMSLDEQDELRDRILGLWPDARVIDRRTQPNHGYRAIHVVPKVGGCLVEIQIRTIYQNVWAQVMEKLADAYGRAIRYGGGPDAPDDPTSGDAGVTQGELVSGWITMSESLANLEEYENRMGRPGYRESLSPDDRAALEALEQEKAEPLRLQLRQLNEALASPAGSLES